MERPYRVRRSRLAVSASSERIIEAYAHATSVEARGAVMLGDETIDEASHKMARAIVARGRAARMSAGI